MTFSLYSGQAWWFVRTQEGDRQREHAGQGSDLERTSPELWLGA